MPIAHLHLVDPTPEQKHELLRRASQAYADVFESPIERVCVFIHAYPADCAAVGGVLASEGPPPAPFFSLLAMGGRAIEQQQRAVRVFTDLLEDVLGVDRARIRGMVTEANPDTWGIGGEPASQVRSAEIAARAQP